MHRAFKIEDYPSMAIVLWLSTFFGSLFGTESLRIPSSYLALISLLFKLIANIEGSAHSTGITLLADVRTILFILFFLIKTFRSTDGQITILKLCFYFVSS